MKTSRRTILTAAAILACATAPAASARPATDSGSARPPVAQPATPASIAAHHEQISQQQYVASHRPPSPVPPADNTDTDSQFPLAIVLVGISILLGIGLASILVKPVRAHARHRRPPASVA